MKIITIFLYYFLATSATVILTLFFVGGGVDLFFWLLYKTPYEFSIKEFLNYLKIGCIAGVICGIGGLYYYIKTIRTQK